MSESLWKVRNCVLRGNFFSRTVGEWSPLCVSLRPNVCKMHVLTMNILKTALCREEEALIFSCWYIAWSLVCHCTDSQSVFRTYIHHTLALSPSAVSRNVYHVTRVLVHVHVYYYSIRCKWGWNYGSPKIHINIVMERRVLCVTTGFKTKRKHTNVIKKVQI